MYQLPFDYIKVITPKYYNLHPEYLNNNNVILQLCIYFLLDSSAQEHTFNPQYDFPLWPTVTFWNSSHVPLRANQLDLDCQHTVGYSLCQHYSIRLLLADADKQRSIGHAGKKQLFWPSASHHFHASLCQQLLVQETTKWRG